MTSTIELKVLTMNRMRSMLLAVTAVVVAACGQPTLIDRTQLNYTKKSDLLDGTWYIKESIVDGPKTTGAASVIGYGGELDKVRWEIQEDLLIGYRSYEVVPGADPRVDRTRSTTGRTVFQDGRAYKGNPVFAYKILSHFDRQRQYNAATGEQTNVLVEDTSDRPWFEREFMRVDWRNNQVENFNNCTGPDGHRWCLRTSGLYMRFIQKQDQTSNDDAQVFERDAAGKLKYFDFTSQIIAQPPQVYYPGYGLLPMCMLNPLVDCESQDVKIRTSVLRVDEDHVRDYEPLVYGEKLMKKFGFFRTERYSYDKDYYYTESGRQLFAMRHNLWKQAKRKVLDANGAPTIDKATGLPVLQTIPVTQRDLKPVVYYMTANTPKELWSAATMRHAKEAGFEPKDTIEASWDHSFRRTVAVPRGIEASEVPQMFYVCESPVPEGAPAACGKPGTYARIGDLRYNMMPYVDQNAGGLLGLGPSAMDPETGEVVTAAANVYGPGLDTWAGSSQQVIDVLNGDVTLEELVMGKDAKDYVFERLNPTDPRRPLNGPWNSQQPLTADSTKPMSTMLKPQGRLADLMSTWRDQGTLPLAKQNRREVVEKLIADNPSLESELFNLPEIKVGVQSITASPGFRARLENDPAFYRQVARNVVMGIDPVAEARAKLKNRPDPSVGCFYEFSYSDEDYVGVAKRKQALYNNLRAKYAAQGAPSCANTASCTTAEATSLAKAEVFNSLRREAFRSVTEHEIGHTLGLMHNFIASADAINYKDGYWDLRKETIGVVSAGRRVLPITPQNMVDAAKPNQHQLDEGIYEYTYSSIMDYGARVTAQNKGVGKYDDAALLFVYGGGFEPGWVEVFNTLRTDYSQTNITVPVDNQAKVFTVRGAHVELPLAHVEHYTPVSNFYTDKYHYATMPFHFADQNASFEAMLDQGIQRMNSRSFRRWSEMAAHYTRVEQELKNYILSSGGLAETDFVRARDIVNAAGGAAIPVEVPFMFCSDYEVGANLLCNRNDQGADIYEMSSKWVERFNQSYVFSNFRRDRLQYSPAAVASGKYSRLLGNIPNIYQQWLFNIYYLTNYYQLSPEELDQVYGLGDPIWQNYWTMAVVDSTNLLMQQLAVPSVGYHGKRADGTWVTIQTGDPTGKRLGETSETAFIERMKLAPNNFTDVLYIPRGPGRAMFTVYDTAGFDAFTRVNEAGHFWDVYAALLALTTSETNFLGVDRGSDALRYSLPYYSTFNKELASVFSAYWAETSDTYAPTIVKNADGTGSVMLPTFVRAQDYVFGFNYPPAPATPVDNVGPVAGEKVLPNPTWSARFWAQLFGMAYFTTNFNLEYAEYSKVFRIGSNEALTAADGYDTITFDDPFGGGYVYGALKRIGDPLPASGYTMVQRGRDQTEKWAQVCRLDRGLPPNAPVALPCVATGAAVNRVDGFTRSEWEGKVRETVRSLEMMRGLYGIFGTAF